jgi:hypothetical protein
MLRGAGFPDRHGIDAVAAREFIAPTIKSIFD